MLSVRLATDALKLLLSATLNMVHLTISMMRYDVLTVLGVQYSLQDIAPGYLHPPVMGTGAAGSLLSCAVLADNPL